MFRTSSSSCLAVSLLAAVALAQQGAPTIGSLRGTLVDPASPDPKRVHGDAREFRAEIKDGRVECLLRMEKPFVDGIFVSAELFIDCDNNPKTGDAGDELRIRGVVGSRFQPSNAEPTNGTRKAIEHTRISQSYWVRVRGDDWTWMNTSIAAEPPIVDGAEMRFWFPLARVREFGDRYSSKFSFEVRVDSSCSDQPLEILHSGTDEGLPIVLDGKDTEWTGRRTRDRGDELHAHLRCADLTSLRVDHSAERLFAAVTLAEPGFSAWKEDFDVKGVPLVSFYLEPMYPRYQEPVQRVVRGGRASAGTDKSEFQSVGGDRCVEVAFVRKKGQGRFRVLVRSDVELQDRFETRMQLDAEGK